jgi:hypothetical protein
LWLASLVFTAAHDSASVREQVIVVNGDQTGVIKLLQHLKQTVPFPGWEFADKIVDLLRRSVGPEMNAAVPDKVVVIPLRVRWIGHFYRPLASTVWTCIHSVSLDQAENNL